MSRARIGLGSGEAGVVSAANGRAGEEIPGGALGWKLSLTHIIAPGSFHGLLRLEDGRLIPISRTHGEDVFKCSWVTFSR